MIKKTILGSLAAVVVAVTFASLAHAATITTVTPSNMDGWVFVNDQTEGPGSGTFVNGPATPPLGTGSAQLTATSSSDGQILAKPVAQVTKLGDVTSLQYSTYQDAANGSALTAIALQLNIDTDVTDAITTWQGRLVYEPYFTQTIATSTWQTWNTLNDAAGTGTGNWWFSNSAVATASGCSQATPCTWAEVLAAYPNIGVNTTTGAIVLKAGSGWPSFSGNVDAVTIGVSGNEVTYNFELVTPDTTAPAAPDLVSPPNGATTTSAGLTKLDWSDVTDPSSPVTYTFQISTSTATSSDGSFANPAFTSGALTLSEIPVAGIPAGAYYWHVVALDAAGNVSPWSVIWTFTVNNSVPPVSTGPTNKDECKNNGWKTFTNPSFKNQGECVSGLMKKK